MIPLIDEAIKLNKEQYDWCIENFETKEAKELLFKGHIRFAYKMASRFYAGRRFPQEELEGMALKALWESVTKFDPSKGCKLITLAGVMINNEICKHIRKYKNIPDDTSLNEAKTDTGEDRATELIHALEDKRDQIGIYETQIMMREYMNILPEKERTMFELYYIQDMNQPAIAKKMKCSQVQVARLLKRGRGRILIKMATGKTQLGNVYDADVTKAKHILNNELGIKIK